MGLARHLKRPAGAGIRSVTKSVQTPVCNHLYFVLHTRFRPRQISPTNVLRQGDENLTSSTGAMTTALTNPVAHVEVRNHKETKPTHNVKLRNCSNRCNVLLVARKLPWNSFFKQIHNLHVAAFELYR